MDPTDAAASLAGDDSLVASDEARVAPLGVLRRILGLSARCSERPHPRRQIDATRCHLHTL